MFVLVVEDGPVERKLLENAMTKNFSGVEVVSCASEDEALLICDETPPDLIITDVRLAQGDGLELCRKIKAKPSPCNGIPILVISSEPSPLLMAIKSMAEGAYSFIPKPFCLKALVETVRDGIRLAAARQAQKRAVEMTMAHLAGGPR